MFNYICFCCRSILVLNEIMTFHKHQKTMIIVETSWWLLTLCNVDGKLKNKASNTWFYLAFRYLWKCIFIYLESSFIINLLIKDSTQHKHSDFTLSHSKNRIIIIIIHESFKIEHEMWCHKTKAKYGLKIVKHFPVTHSRFIMKKTRTKRTNKQKKWKDMYREIIFQFNLRGVFDVCWLLFFLLHHTNLGCGNIKK